MCFHADTGKLLWTLYTASTSAPAVTFSAAA